MKFDDYAHMAIEDSLKDYFQSNFDIDPSHVMYVNPCFSIDDFYKVSDRFTTVQKHMGIIKAYCQEEGIEDGEYKSRMEAEHEGMPKVKTGMCSSAVLDLAAVQTEMNEVTDLIAAQEKTVGNQGDVEEQEKAFTKIVFVVFEYPSDCQKVCEGQTHWTIRILKRIIDPCGICFDKSAYYAWSRAPEPSDVYWENLHVNLCQRYMRLVIANLLTVILVILCFAGISLLKKIQKNGLITLKAEAEEFELEMKAK